MKKIKNLKFAGLAALAALAVALLFQTSITRAGDKGDKGDKGKKGDHGQKGGDKEKGDRDHRDAIITWTKYVTAFLPPGEDIFATIAGTAEGDLGCGTVIGDAFNPRELLPDGFVTFEAEYHFIGSKHSLTVHFRTVQGPDPSGVVRGVITGVVTDGWLKGNVVEGEYVRYACPQQEGSVNGLCFDGIFEIKRGSKNKH